MKNRTAYFVSGLTIALSSVAALVACSSSGTTGGGGSTTDSSTSFPMGFAVSSPTTAQPASLALGSSKVRASAFDSSKSFAEKKEEIADLAAASTIASCKVQLPNFGNAAPVSCYGPRLNFRGHINDSTPDGNDVDDDQNDDEGQLPSGDLGLWSATEADGTACAAAKMNSEINSIASRVDAGLLLAASFNCFMKASDASLPGTGGELDLTSTMSTSLAEVNTGFTLTEASVTRGADVDGLPVYQYKFTGTIGSSSIDFNSKHHPTIETGAEYFGQMWAKTGGGGNDFGFSIAYEKDTSTVKYEMYSANFPSNTTESNMFTNGALKLDGAWNGNIAMTKANIDATSGRGVAAYAWQAGTNDSHARIFNAYTTTSGSDVVGYGWFGFGQKFDKTAGTASNGVVDRFICNWAGPGNNHTGLAGEAQKQIMKMVSGKFVPSPDVGNPDLIDYAPVNTCDLAAASNMNYEIASGMTYSAPPAGSHAAVTNELVTLSSDTHYTAMPAMTSPAGF